MIDHREKLLSFDEFKEKVYKNIDFLETIDNNSTANAIKEVNTGCLGMLFNGLFVRFAAYANTTLREKMEIGELTIKAERILAQKEIKDFLCAKLDANVILPIDAAYLLTPVLYKLALKDEENVPMSSTLFAIICRKITIEGVYEYCA